MVADTVISTPGQYVLRRISGQGFYTVYHITATSSGPITEHIYDYDCSGRVYAGITPDMHLFDCAV